MNRLLPFLLLFCAEGLQGQSLPQNISSDADVIVVAFLAVDCPISQKYIPTLNAIAARYDKDAVALHAFIPGKLKAREKNGFIREYAISFPVSSDKTYRVVKALQAVTTPEVFVFDDKGRLKYSGAIDNWFYALGGYRHEATEEYLKETIEALLAGKAPPVAQTKAIGCYIERR